MRKLSMLGAIAALLLGAAATMAASPPPGTQPSTTPSKPAPSTLSASQPASTQSSWTAQVQPLRAVTGSVTVAKNADGTGLVTLKLDGMGRNAAWIVDVDGGTIARPNERDEIASKRGDDVARTGADTLTVKLTAAEMRAFLRDQAKVGVVVFVHDGSRISAAAIPAA